MNKGENLTPLLLRGGVGGGGPPLDATLASGDRPHLNPVSGRSVPQTELGLPGAVQPETPEEEGLFEAQYADLARLAEIGRLRSLTPSAGIDFASNDYLGLAASGRLAEAARAALDRGVPVGSGGSRLLRGNCEEHEALEAEMAAFIGAEAALFFATGYTAN